MLLLQTNLLLMVLQKVEKIGELDVLLERYLRTHYDAASREQQAAFAELLELQDPELYALLLGRRTETDPVVQHVIEAIRGTADH